jgi:hypothetical protein
MGTTAVSAAEHCCYDTCCLANQAADGAAPRLGNGTGTHTAVNCAARGGTAESTFAVLTAFTACELQHGVDAWRATMFGAGLRGTTGLDLAHPSIAGYVPVPTQPFSCVLCVVMCVHHMMRGCFWRLDSLAHGSGSDAFAVPALCGGAMGALGHAPPDEFQHLLHALMICIDEWNLSAGGCFAMLRTRCNVTDVTPASVTQSLSL